MTTARWVLLILIAVFLTAPQIQAGEGGDYSYRRHRHHNTGTRDYCASDFWGRCSNVAQHRHAYRWRYYNYRRYDGHRRYRNYDHDHNRWFVPGSGERIDHGLACHARRRVVGEERPSRAKAQRAADNAWMGAVRYDHGERYQDINNAKDIRHNCDPSSTTTILKRVFFRCVLEATPCRAATGASGDRVERRYEEETDEDDK